MPYMTARPDSAAAVAALERRYTGPVPAHLLAAARAGSARRRDLIRALAESRALDALAGRVRAGLAGRRSCLAARDCTADRTLARLAVNLDFYRSVARRWHDRAERLADV